MQPIINDNLPRNYQKCWLPSSTDIPWLIRYLDNVYLPEGEDIIKSTLINEITALNHNIKNSKSLQEASLSFVLDENNMVSEQYSIDYQNDTIRIVSGGWQGFLYAWFDLLRKASSVLNSPWQSTQKPAFPVRMINHWDNLDGTVERGYAGNSLFFHNNQIHYDEIRLHHYARLLASVGINAIAINNVNVHHHETALIDDSLLPSVAQIAAIFRQYAIRLFLSVNFASQTR